MRGELPRVISEKGVEWQEVAEGTARMTDTLQGEVRALREQGESITLQLRPDERDDHSVERKRLTIESPEWWDEWDRGWEAFDRAREQYYEARERLLRLARRR